MKRISTLFAIVAVLFCVIACEKAAPLAPVSAGAEETQLDPWIFEDMSGQILMERGPETSVVAGFEDEAETRTTLSMNAEQTHAQVLWKKGDVYKALSKSGNSYYAAFYTTQNDGVADATFTGQYAVYGSPWCFYPNSDHIRFRTSSTGQMIFGMNLPNEQTPVAGGVTSGLMLSYAHPASASAHVSFRNITSLVRFRLSGSLVSSITKITLKGASTIAGDFIFVEDNGEPVVARTEAQFVNDEPANSVTLRGSFVAGQDYYIAVLPAEFSHMTLVFSDDNKHSSTKISSGKITTTRSRITDLGTIDLGSEFSDGEAPDPAMLYMEHTQGTKPATIAVIPEGFVLSELTAYEALAKSAVDALFETEPYKTYKNYFNVWIMKVASQESGASITDGNGTITTAKNTYFGARWGESSYKDMAADGTEVYAFVSENCPDIINHVHSIDEVPVMMIINDSRYGGICHSTSSGRGYAMCPYTYDGGSIHWSYPSYQASTDEYEETPSLVSVSSSYISENKLQNDGDWRNTAVHEFGGHCFGRLGDEYWTDYMAVSGPVDGHGWTVPFSLNISASYNDPPWKAHLLDNLETLVQMDPNYSRIGIFQGGDTHPLWRWRSERISCMIDNRFYFSTWQRELIVKRIMSLSGGTFSLQDFIDNDVTTDPVRDQISSGAPKPWASFPVRISPPLPPPVLTEVAE